ncbi:MAG: hypothetical protein VX438_11115 [Planctomycetota bacterium]|nr:hypothetical protein [Planctomycetota bacterium]
MRFFPFMIVVWASGLSGQQEPENRVPRPETMSQALLQSLLAEPHSPEDLIPEISSVPRPGVYRFRFATGLKDAQADGYLKLKVVRRRFLVQHPLKMEGLAGVVVWAFDDQLKTPRHWSGTREGKILEHHVSYGDKQLFTESLATVANGKPLLELNYRVDEEGNLVGIQGVYREGEEEMPWQLVLERAGEPDLELQKHWIERNLVLFMVSIHLCWIVPTVLFLIFYPIYVRKQEAKRTLELRAATEELGLDFAAEGDLELNEELASLPLTTIGRARELKNLISADTPDLQLGMFDYKFVVGHGKSKKTRRLTAIAVRSADLRLPSCHLRPKRAILDTVGAMFGRQDINFENHEKFSQAFVLKSESEEETREFFDEPLLDFFAARTDICFELQQGSFIYFRQWKRVEPVAEKIRDFLGEAYVVLQALNDRQSRSDSR